jgi:hypothetical protein
VRTARATCPAGASFAHQTNSKGMEPEEDFDRHLHGDSQVIAPADMTHACRLPPAGRGYTVHDAVSTCLAGQAVGIKEVDDGIWLVSFMDYDLGYIDLEEKTLQPLPNPFGPKVLPMS